MRKTYLGPDSSTSMKLKRSYADLAAELSRVAPGGPAYPVLERLLAEIDAAHSSLFGRPVKESVPADRCGPGPSWAETGLK